MQWQGSIVNEPQYICDVCGRKKPVSQMAGKCVKCGKYVCSTCAKVKNDRVYCPAHAGACFIATAAFGTPMAQEINTLRRFRDVEMEPSLIGRHLVYLYYDVSPPIARVISRSKNMRSFVRLNLKPIIHSLESRNKRKAC